MTPSEQAAAVYSREYCPRTFWEDVRLHMANGLVIATPDLFLLARPVVHDSGYEAITNPAIVHANPDCWHLYLYSGHLADAFKCAPYPLKYVSFERTNVLKIYPWVYIQRKCSPA